MIAIHPYRVGGTNRSWDLLVSTVALVHRKTTTRDPLGVRWSMRSTASDPAILQRIDELCATFEREWELAHYPSEDGTITQLEAFRMKMLRRVRDGLELPERWCCGALAEVIDERLREFGTTSWRDVAHLLKR